MWELFELTTLGIGIGFASGALGLGGGFILMPILFTFYDWPILSAVATSHFCGLATSAGATSRYAKAGLVDWSIGVRMETAALFGAALAAYYVAGISPIVFAVLFGVVALIAAVKMWLPAQNEHGNAPGPTTMQQWIALPLLSVVGAASAVLGMGGGVLKVPILSGILHMPTRRAVATSALMVGITAATVGSIYFSKGLVSILDTARLVFGMLIGSTIGAALQKHVPVFALRRFFAILLLVFALRVIARIL
jgi:uncharacterized membrane protein YfcA